MCKAGNNRLRSKAFTLLELLTVMALISILSFSVIYSLGTNSRPLKHAQKLVEKLLQTARTTAILKNQECRLMILNDPTSEDHERLLTIAIKEKSGQWKNTGTFATLPKEIGATFSESETVSFSPFSPTSTTSTNSDKADLWNSISFNSMGQCKNSIQLRSSEDSSITTTLIITPGGGIIIDQ